MAEPPPRDRRGALIGSSAINGIDFVSVDPIDPRTLEVHFLNAVALSGATMSAAITGGDSIPAVPVAAIAAGDWGSDAEGRPLLTLRAQIEGDFSEYLLTLSIPAADPQLLDLAFSSSRFSFKANCPSDFDCAPPPHQCPPDDTPVPPIDYLAKDFDSFRRALLDFSALRYPRWVERSEADFGVMFAEVLAAVADDLSYLQDRIAAEAFIETATQRRSLVSLARLVDYEPRPATSGTTWLQLSVAAPGAVPAGLQVSAPAPDGSLIAFETGAGLADTAAATVSDLWNHGILPYWFDDADRCLPAGATELWVAGDGFGFVEDQAILLQTDLPGDSQRRLVHLVATAGVVGFEATDPLFGNAAVTRIRWRPSEATDRDIDLTRTTLGGNIVRATQGARVTETFAIGAPPATAPGATLAIARRGPDGDETSPNWVHRYPLARTPLAWLAQADAEAAPRPEMLLAQALPTVRDWAFPPTLLKAEATDLAVTIDPVAWRAVGFSQTGAPTHWDIDGDGGSTLRFGDGVFGAAPAEQDLFTVTYRTGVGAGGNVAVNTIARLAPGGAGIVTAARNPFAVTDGADAETRDQIVRRAPQAFRARQFRAVRPEDYEAAAETLPWVQKAGTSFRWTGSWLTVFTAVDPIGAEQVDLAHEIELVELLNRRRLAGYESYAPAPRYLSLDLRIEVCAKPGWLDGDVEAAVLDRLGSSDRADAADGFFFADRFTFGSPLYRSRLEAAIQEVPGVLGVRAVLYRQRGSFAGFVDLPEAVTPGTKQILRVDNDPDWPERGTIRVTVEGGPMTFPICPCDDDTPRVPVNLPQQDALAFRYGDYAEFRRALLTPQVGETSLTAWRTQGEGDLAVMMVEWFAYLADILTFYDERITNESYLRTARLEASAKRLIAILGYRPRAAIGATGAIAALVTRGQSAVLPKGLQFQSKPAPGQQPQTFELSADTPIGAPDLVAAIPPPHLLAEIGPFRFQSLSVGLTFLAPARLLSQSVAYQTYQLVSPPPTLANFGLLLLGEVTAINPGDDLLLSVRDAAKGGPFLARVTQAVVQDAPAGGKQTALALDITDDAAGSLAGGLAGSLATADCALEKPNQTISVWNLYAGGAAGTQVHLSSLARQIRPGHWVLFTAPGWSFLAQVQTSGDVIWDAKTPADPLHPLPIPHTLLTLEAALSSWPFDKGSITVRFDWVGAAKLVDQPPGWWNGTPTALVAATATRFRAAPTSPVLLEAKDVTGVRATAASAGDFNVQLGGLPAPVPALAAPIDVYYNVLEITRGKTVAKEVLGSGDAARAAQSFKLSQSPVTWLMAGASPASTVAVRVDGEPWVEVASFYGQPPDAQVFVTREDVEGATHVDFGDGVEGARLPTGRNNVVADYRVGAGAASPAAGKLTVLSAPRPGLRAIRNPVAVGGGADAEPAAQIRRYAPRSVLTFGRAVSVFDYEALAAQAPGVTRARATWSWSDVLQRAAVVVYVGDDAAAVASAKGVLAGAGDPNRPVQVTAATAVPVTLAIELLVIPGWDADQIVAQAAAALVDAERGLFSPLRMAIGSTLFDSQIEQAVLAVPGTVAISASVLTLGGVASSGPLHAPGDGGYFALDPLDLTLTVQGSCHGG